MSASHDDARREWIKRVLGLDISPPGENEDEEPAAAAPANGVTRLRDRWREARAAWTDASYEADQQLAALTAYLRGTGDEELEDIAEFGFTDFAAHGAALRDAMPAMEAASDPVVMKAAPNVLALVRNFLVFLGGDRRVGASDGNPFRVRVALSNTLTPALKSMEQALTAD